MSDRTLSALDWEVVLEALARHARTTRGASVALRITLAGSVMEVRERYAEVAEVLAIEAAGDRVPVGSVVDVADEVERASRGLTLEPIDLRVVLSSIRALHVLRVWADDLRALVPRLAALATPITIDPALLETLGTAFDAAGQLSTTRWPELGVLRHRVDSLRDRIRSTLDEIVRGEEWGDALQDRYITEREGRFVVPVKMGARRGLGIVHGTSHSGETAYVEPAVVVELHNDMRTAKGDLSRLERRILAELSHAVALRSRSLLPALDAATTIDLACARAGLGKELRGTLPIVGTEGVIALRASRHPVLALRGDVVPNDLALGPEHPGLVLTGPNAGGKTVALKTLGLAALLVRAAIPIPADAPSRVDFFDPILADVGDAQSVAGGLSTFSAHVGALKTALAGSRQGALVLLDEVAVGTDPAQGAALARAVLECVVDAGARVAVTTHYPELKAIVDPRFVIAAAQYADGKPTYRLELGVPGPSYALAMAQRLGLPESVLVRARELLDTGARELAERLEQLAAEGATMRRKTESLATQEEALAERARRMAVDELRLARDAEKRVRALTDAAEGRLRAREEEVRAMVAALQAGADLRTAGNTLADIRAALADVRTPPPVPRIPEGPPPVLAVGDRVRVRTIGQVGQVISLGGSGGGQVEVEVGSVRMRVPLAQLEAMSKPAARRPMLAADRLREAAARAEPRDSDGARDPNPARGRTGADPSGARLRTGANTCDLRGMRAEEAIEAAERFLDGLTLARFSPGFLLHGHGTGALKVAIRAWLPGCRYARGWRPADADEGGDAYTVVEVG